MFHRLIIGLLLTATLAACQDGGLTGAGSSSATATVSSSATVTATPITLQGVPPSNVAVGNNYYFQPSVSSNSGAVTFAVEGLPAWATFDSSTGAVSGTPGTSDVGLSGEITITATNGSNTGSVGPFTIRVNAASGPSDSPPTISGTPPSGVVAGQSYWFQPVLGDAGGHPLTVSIANCPTWASFNTQTGALSGTPSAAQAGTYPNIVISVSDGTTQVSLPAFTIMVTQAGTDVPVISGKPATTVGAGESYQFEPSASDPASRTLTYSIANRPAWASFSAASGALTGTPSQAGSYANIVITVSNGSASASLPAFSITVTAPADAPSISGTPVSSVAAGQAYHFQPSASDPAGQALSFSIVNKPAWAGFDTATGLLSGTPASTDVGSYPNIVISASSGTSSASLPAFSIVVVKPTAAGSPTISGTPSTSVVVGNSYRFTPTTTDPSGGALTFSIKNAPSWAAFNPSTGELAGVPAAGDVGTYSNIVISVSDGKTTAALPAFPISVTEGATGSATISWVAPTDNTDGTPLTNLAGYFIFYGTSPDSLTKSVQITSPGIATYVISNLSPGTWYFSMTAYTTADVQSIHSGVASGAVK